jgi:ABC-2 type transport system ATP-binding protein
MVASIEIEGLVKRYGDHPAVQGVSFSVEEGEAFGYLGPNGAGKTTTIRCLLGLIRAQGGRLRLLGRDIPGDLLAVAGEVGHLPGELGLWPQLTGRECLDYLGSLSGRVALDRTKELCERFELSEADLDRQVRLYSRGMKQKIGLIQTFQHRPRVVILDEPTEGLDPVMKERFLELLQEHRRQGGTVFLSSHILSEVERATDRVAVLRSGRLVKIGPTADLTGERIRHCVLTVKEPIQSEALAVQGVSHIEGDGQRFRFDVAGDMEPLIRVLAGLRVEELVVEPERLEEAFLEVYEDDGGAP